jgi:hypothetical protein
MSQTSYQQYYNPAVVGTIDSAFEPIVDAFAAAGTIAIGSAVVQSTSANTYVNQLTTAITAGSNVAQPSAVSSLSAGELITGVGITIGTTINRISGGFAVMSEAATLTNAIAALVYGSPNAEQGIMQYPTVVAPTVNTQKFLGIAILQEGSEQSLVNGTVQYVAGNTVPTASWGRIWARIDPTLIAGAITYGDPVYWIPSGTNAGCFTNVSTGNVAVANAKFRSNLSITGPNGSIAIVEMR